MVSKVGSGSADDWHSFYFPEPALPPASPMVSRLGTRHQQERIGVFKASRRFVFRLLQRVIQITIFVCRTILTGCIKAVRLRIVQVVLMALLLLGVGVVSFNLYGHIIDHRLGGRKNPSFSCKTLKQSTPSSRSSIYWVNPPDTLFSVPFRVFCDMETDGGGWTLMLAYDRKASENQNLNPRELPLSVKGYSHALLYETMTPTFPREKYADEVRFYCHTTAHPRQLHFKITDTSITRAVLCGKGYSCNTNTFRNHWRPLEGHTAHLPAETEDCWHEVLRHPFFKGHRFHWNIRYAPSEAADAVRWECDDLSSEDHGTHHEIWVR